MVSFQTTGSAARVIAALAVASIILGCGTRRSGEPEAEAPPSPATAANSVVMPPVSYGTTGNGLRLVAADDKCDVPALLQQNLQDQIEAPYQYLLSGPTAGAEAAPVLKIEITDLLANAGGLYGGPKIVELRGTLERPGAAPARFTARRQMFMYFGLPRSTCSMVGNVAYQLGADIAQWLKAPADQAFLGER